MGHLLYMSNRDIIEKKAGQVNRETGGRASPGDLAFPGTRAVVYWGRNERPPGRARTGAALRGKGESRMELKKVWMVPDTAGKSRYSLRVLGGIAGITALAVALIGAGVWLTFALELPREGFSLFLVCAVTALMVALARKTGRSVGLCRAVVEIGVIILGWLLGGQVGIGTVISAVVLGTLFNLNFALFRFRAAEVHQENLMESFRNLKRRVQTPSHG